MWAHLSLEIPGNSGLALDQERQDMVVQVSGLQRHPGYQSHLIANVLPQLAVELPVYSDQRFGWTCVKDSQGGYCHPQSTYHTCISLYAYPRNDYSCRTSVWW